MKSDISELKETLSTIQFNVSLKNHSTFRIGGKAKYFFVAKTKKDLILAVNIAKKLSLPFYLLGGGSKLLISDKGFDGLIIKVKNSKFKLEGNEIFAEAGVSLEKITKLAAENSLSGLEWAAGIPGTVGGAIRGNAGAWGISMKDIVKEVEVFDVKKQKIVFFNNKDCKFGYRTSVFKENPNLVVLSCKISLKKGNKEKSKQEMKEYIEYRKKHHPLAFPSVGSIFENFTPSSDKIFELYPEFLQFKKNKEIPAGFLIAECGLVGKRIGDVKISEKHSNFIINVGDGKAEDVKKLIKLAKEKVKERFGIELKEEIQYL